MKTLSVLRLSGFFVLLCMFTLLLTGCPDKKDNPEPDNTPPSATQNTPAKSGQAMFWTAVDLGFGSVTVTCNGINKIISNYYAAGAPACGVVGAATFDLPAGSYDFTATCSGGLSWKGSIAVVGGACTKWQLTGGTGNTGNNTTAKGKATFWTATNSGCGTIDVTCAGLNKAITSYYSTSTPTCTSPGTASYDLSPGTYPYTAKCGTKSWSGNVTVSANGCSTVQLTDSSPGTGSGGAAGTCSIKALGSISSVGFTNKVWSSWLKVADVGNGAVYVSYKVSDCGKYGLNGYSFYRIMNTCTSISTCNLNFSYEYQDCEGKLHTEGLYAIKLDHSYTEEKTGMWFLGAKVTKSFVSGSVMIK